MLSKMPRRQHGAWTLHERQMVSKPTRTAEQLEPRDTCCMMLYDLAGSPVVPQL